MTQSYGWHLQRLQHSPNNNFQIFLYIVYPCFGCLPLFLLLLMLQCNTHCCMAGTYLRLFQTISKNSFIWRPKRLVSAGLTMWQMWQMPRASGLRGASGSRGIFFSGCATRATVECRLARMHIHCVSKKQDTKLLPITSLNVYRFSKFFHWQTHW